MDLLKVMAMPFQVTSLIFVALSSLLFGWLLGGGPIQLIAGLAGLWVMLIWFNTWAFRMIEDAANGVRQTAVPDTDMASPVADARAWVHPSLAAGMTLLHWMNPDLPWLPTLLAAALLYPPSIAATAMSGLARDALNPAAILNVIRGLGAWYPALVLTCAGFALLGLQIARALGRSALMFALLELLLLTGYACIGGVVHLRRVELGFAPRFSPERTAEREDGERLARRQRMLDELFEQSRGRHSDRALEVVTQWLRGSEPHHWLGDLRALIETGGRWREPREFARLLRGLLPWLVQSNQVALAMTVADAGLAAAPGFAPTDEATAVALIDYAVQGGRRRAAASLLSNYLHSLPADQTTRLGALRSRWPALL